MSRMGTFYTTIHVAPVDRRAERRAVANALVDTGSEFTWVPREVLEELGIVAEHVEPFQTADGRTLERPVGWGAITVGSRSAPDLVVFAEPGDVVLLGAHALEGLNLRVDARLKQLIPAGPIHV
jgi:predicted aspartyl protease